MNTLAGNDAWVENSEGCVVAVYADVNGPQFPSPQDSIMPHEMFDSKVDISGPDKARFALLLATMGKRKEWREALESDPDYLRAA